MSAAARERVEGIRARAEAATNPPWELSDVDLGRIQDCANSIIDLSQPLPEAAVEAARLTMWLHLGAARFEAESQGLGKDAVQDNAWRALDIKLASILERFLAALMEGEASA